jgi:hypothetical protein
LESEVVSNTAGFCFLGAIGVALAFPWVALALDRGSQTKWTAVLAGLATVLFLTTHLTMPSKYNIRVDLLIFPPLILVAWLQCLGFWLASDKLAKVAGQKRGQPIRWRKGVLLTLAFIVGLIVLLRFAPLSYVIP